MVIWMNEWTGVRALLRITYSNQKHIMTKIRDWISPYKLYLRAKDR